MLSENVFFCKYMIRSKLKYPSYESEFLAMKLQSVSYSIKITLSKAQKKLHEKLVRTNVTTLNVNSTGQTVIFFFKEAY